MENKAQYFSCVGIAAGMLKFHREEQRSVVRFCGLKDVTRVKFTGTCVTCMGKIVWTVATLIMRTTWRRCYSPYSLPHTRHKCPINFTQVMPFSPQKSHFAALHTLTTVTSLKHLCCIVHASLPRAAYKKNCVCSENFKLYLGEISTSQPQYQRRKKLLCVSFRSTLVEREYCLRIRYV